MQKYKAPKYEGTRLLLSKINERIRDMIYRGSSSRDIAICQMRAYQYEKKLRRASEKPCPEEKYPNPLQSTLNLSV